MAKAPYANLVAWQRADDSFIELHKLTVTTFPKFEQYELASQIRRAAYSVPANIAEGNSRLHERDSLHFLNIASSSLAEVGYGVHAANRLGYLLPDVQARLDLMVRRAAAPLAGLIRRVRQGDRLLSQGKPQTKRR
jgi:four helix bundle protein